MNKDQNQCNLVLLNQFFDKEIGTDENDRIQKHLTKCPVCQKVVHDNRSIAHFFRKHLEQMISPSEFNSAGDGIIALIREKKTPWWMRIQDACRMKMRLLPATVMIAVLVIFFSLVKHNGYEPGPSAIIRSFSSDVSSVMFMETQKNHQTIIWFNDTDIAVENNQKGRKA